MINIGLAVTWCLGGLIFSVGMKRSHATLPDVVVLTAMQYCVGTLALAGMVVAKAVQPVSQWWAWRRELALSSALFFAGTLCTNVSLVLISVSLTHVVKSLEPLFAVVITFVMDGDLPRPAAAAAIITSLLGTLLACTEQRAAADNPAQIDNGILMAVLSNVAIQLRNFFNKKLLAGVHICSESCACVKHSTPKRRPLDSCTLLLVSFALVLPLQFALLQLYARTASLSVGLLMRRIAFSTSHYKHHDEAHPLWLLFTPFAFVVYQLASLLLLSRVDTVTHAVLNGLKRVVVIGLGSWYMLEPITGGYVVGAAVAIVGASSYPLAKGSLSSKSRMILTLFLLGVTMLTGTKLRWTVRWTAATPANSTDFALHGKPPSAASSGPPDQDQLHMPPGTLTLQAANEQLLSQIPTGAQRQAGHAESRTDLGPTAKTRTGRDTRQPVVSVCRQLIVGASFDCMTEYSLAWLPPVCDVPRPPQADSGFIAPVCVRASDQVSVLISEGRLLAHDAFVDHVNASNANLRPRLLFQRSLVAFGGGADDMNWKGERRVQWSDAKVRKDVWTVSGHNSGNLVWWQAARNMVDVKHAILRPGKSLVHLRGQTSALLIPTANLLMPHSRRIQQKRTMLPAGIAAQTKQLKELVEKLDVPTMILGIGVQVGLMETAESGADSGYNEQSASVKERKSAKKSIRELNVSDLVLEPQQVELLHAVGRTRHGLEVQNIAVRGDVSLKTCRNSGVFNCQSLGCPSLMLSPDTKLGVSLHVKWESVRQRLAQGKQLRLVYSLPALWSDTLAQLLVSAGKEHPDFLIVLQMEVDVTSVQRLRRLGLKVRSSQVKLFVSAEDWIETMKSYDLAICARIHGSMAAIAASIPAVVIATDSRIEELAKRMNIPTVRHLVLKAHMTLNAFLKHFVDFNGTTFDSNRASVAREYVHMLGLLGVPISPHIRLIAH